MTSYGVSTTPNSRPGLFLHKERDVHKSCVVYIESILFLYIVSRISSNRIKYLDRALLSFIPFFLVLLYLCTKNDFNWNREIL